MDEQGQCDCPGCEARRTQECVNVIQHRDMDLRARIETYIDVLVRLRNSLASSSTPEQAIVGLLSEVESTVEGMKAERTALAELAKHVERHGVRAQA